MEKTVIHVFDVDGTLTQQDSFLLLVRFLVPSPLKRYGTCLLAALSVFPFLVVRQMWKWKQAILSKVWRGQPYNHIETQCALFFETVLKNDIRNKALQYIQQLKQDNPDVQFVLLSASCRPWLQPLANHLRADLICTELEWDDSHRFTGRFATHNCKGPEKVRRLLEKYPAARYEFICYADDASDRPLQSISSQFFYRYF